MNHPTKKATTNGFKNPEGKEPDYIPKLLPKVSILISGLYHYISSIKEPKPQKTKEDLKISKEA